MSQKKIVEVKKDKAGNIEKVRFEGNKTFTPKEKAINLAEKGKIPGVHVVHPNKGEEHLRSNPDGDKDNNLGELSND
jgi:hypothetical protein